MAGEPGAVEAGFRLPPRSALVPYPSREEALAGGTSSYVIPLEEWQRDSVPEGVRYTARFKVRYAWDNRAVLLRVEDVPSSFGIEVNGEAAGYSQAGMGRTEFDITDFIRQDYNTVSVIVCEAPAARRIGEGRGRDARVRAGLDRFHRKAGGGGPGCCLSPRYGYTTCLPRLRWTAVTVMWRSISSCRVSC